MALNPVAQVLLAGLTASVAADVYYPAYCHNTDPLPFVARATGADLLQVTIMHRHGDRGTYVLITPLEICRYTAVKEGTGTAEVRGISALRLTSCSNVFGRGMLGERRHGGQFRVHP